MYFVDCVSKIEHILLVIYYSIYGDVCYQFTQFPRDGWENKLLCPIIITKSEVWTIFHCLGLVMKQWYALYVSLYSYENLVNNTPWHTNVNIIGTIVCNYPENEDIFVSPLALLWSLERTTILGLQLVPFCVHTGSTYKFPNFYTEDFTLTSLQESIPRLFNEWRTTMTTHVPRLAARSSQSNPKGSWSEVLKRKRGHVTAQIWSFGGGVFRAIQRNVAVLRQRGSVLQSAKQVHNVGKYGRNPWAKWYWKGGCKLQVQNRVGALAASAMMPGIQILYCQDKAGCTCSFAWALYVFPQFWSTIHCVSVASVFTTCYTHWNVGFS